jgi:hypothetical protein
LKAGETMDYFKMYKDIWELHKKYIDKVDSRDDEIWKSIIVEANELTKKYDNCKFIKNLVMAELEEFERLHHERTK